jgi:hypothetical protein
MITMPNSRQVRKSSPRREGCYLLSILGDERSERRRGGRSWLAACCGSAHSTQHPRDTPSPVSQKKGGGVCLSGAIIGYYVSLPLCVHHTPHTTGCESILCYKSFASLLAGGVVLLSLS